MAKTIQQAIKERILVLDGNYKHFIDKYNLKKPDFHKGRFAKHNIELTGFYDVLNLSRPELIREINEKYLKAGADIISTHTFGANDYILSKYKLEGKAYELNFAAAKIARELTAKYSIITRSKPRFVFGSIGAIDDTIENQEQIKAYEQQLKGLMAGKVDAIWFADFSKKDNLFSAIEALYNILTKRNKVYSVVITLSGEEQMLSEKFVEELESKYNDRIKLLAISEVSGNKIILHSEIPAILFPALVSRGGTSELIKESATDIIKKYEPKILGGCCNNTPEQIETLVKAIKESNA